MTVTKQFPAIIQTFVPRQALMAILAGVLLIVVNSQAAFGAPAGQDDSSGAQSVPLAANAIEQLVAPIALYPDQLAAQILAASTYPDQVVEADRWVQAHSKLKDDKLANEVDKESWDPSVKALTPFPSVLANLDKNLSWTSSLGDAYYNQPQDVIDAIQRLRARAQTAGNLYSNQQQSVVDQGTTIVIEPADPDVCYVPTYDPWLCYGAPIGIYPGYLYDPWDGGPYVSFGLGIGIGGGFWGGFGWGWDNWGFNWGRHAVMFDHNQYYSRSRTFFNRSPGGDRGNVGAGPGRSPYGGNGRTGEPNSIRGGDNPGRDNSGGNLPNRGGSGNFSGGNPGRNQVQNAPNSTFGHGGAEIIPAPNDMGNRSDNRGFGQPSENPGTRSGAFSGFGQGGIERGSSDRGQSSFGGGGGFGGGRGFGGGGGGRGGGGFGGGRGGGGGVGHGGRH